MTEQAQRSQVLRTRQLVEAQRQQRQQARAMTLGELEQRRRGLQARLALLASAFAFWGFANGRPTRVSG
jgi:hypothetical protein